MVAGVVQGVLKKESVAFAAAAAVPGCDFTAPRYLSTDASIASMDVALLACTAAAPCWCWSRRYVGVEAVCAAITLQGRSTSNKLQPLFRKNVFVVRYVLYKFMATYNPLGAYLESKVLSASPLELVCLAYEEAIEAVRLARQCIIEKRIQDRARAITKAQLLIGELQNSLDFHRGGQLSEQLAGLYRYMVSRLGEAHFKQSEEPLEDVENLLGTILESWRELAQGEKAMAATAIPSSYSPEPGYSLADLTL